MPTRLTRAQQQELTRQQLLDAALGIFRQRGFAAATVEEIAELAGYSRGAVYSHFGSKEGAFVNLLELHAPAQIEAFRLAVEAARSEAGLLRAIVAAAMPSADTARSQLVDTVELAARLVDNPDLRRRVLRIQEQTEEVLGRCAAELCRRRGVGLALPEAEVGMAMLAFLTGLAQRLLVEPGLPVERRATQGLLALVLGASTAAPGPEA